jgi:hypothetical protein
VTTTGEEDLTEAGAEPVLPVEELDAMMSDVHQRAANRVNLTLRDVAEMLELKVSQCYRVGRN